jgi:hypothetical protein
VRDSLGRIQKFSAVGKRVGRDVDDTHDECRPRKNEFKLSGVEKDFAGSGHGWIMNGLGPIAQAHPSPPCAIKLWF